ncbi:MAG TPA: PIG-L family deacetylase [Casimicrobiaceae bacterium]|nr:PIG-L family deacetylase [Casimicrobiaceae bacterium]
MHDALRRLFVSPHLDDAVFACGEWIASSANPLVVTIFAGFPRAGAPLTSWDRECGFNEGDDVIALRRDEDRAALDSLGAVAVQLDFRDDQYGELRSTAVAADALASIVERETPHAIHVPLGLFHADHCRSAEASLALFDRFATRAWHVYEDAIYRRIPGAVDERTRALVERGFVFERRSPAMARDAAARKRRAVACYRSQLRALRTRNAHDDMFAPERHWALSRSPGLR